MGEAMTEIYHNSRGGFREEYLRVKYPEFAGGGSVVRPRTASRNDPAMVNASTEVRSTLRNRVGWGTAQPVASIQFKGRWDR